MGFAHSLCQLQRLERFRYKASGTLVQPVRDAGFVPES